MASLFSLFPGGLAHRFMPGWAPRPGLRLGRQGPLPVPIGTVPAGFGGRGVFGCGNALPSARLLPGAPGLVGTTPNPPLSLLQSSRGTCVWPSTKRSHHRRCPAPQPVSRPSPSCSVCRGGWGSDPLRGSACSCFSQVRPPEPTPGTPPAPESCCQRHGHWPASGRGHPRSCLRCC